MRKYTKWSNALKAFVEYINKDVSDDFFYGVNSETRRHKTARDINLRLRFKVMQRDNFKCCTCGASPAKDPSVELRIDHIIPWPKGGETEIDNLQTLCSKCNLGKSDLA
ncbi:MAG: HNH endonuclease [Ruminococcaceae bacterium]|nr:HNH endonuclease [Oscillospiraceae bacterium]